MGLLILPDKQTVIKDGVSLVLPELSYPDCNAIQWHGTKGFYEYDSGNTMFTDQAEVQDYIDAFDAEIQKQNTKPETNEWEEATYSNGTWVVSEKANALEIAKQVKCDEINAERDYRQSLSLEYTFPDGTGHIQRRGQKDERNIQGVASAAMTLVLDNNTADTVHFTDEENVSHVMTGVEGMQFGVFVQQDYARLQSAARQHKDTVNALTTVNDVKNYDYSGGWE